MTDRPSLLLYCQHSLGVGHLKRSWALASALATDFHVTVASGGMPPRGLRPPNGIHLADLPALAQHADGGLFVVDGAYTVAEAQRTRRDRLLHLYETLRPAVVLIELFPFGRRKFTDEILTLLEQARRSMPRPIVATSVRDLLVDRGAEQQDHDDRVRQLLDDYFDVVLVHADPRFATLDQTFRPAIPVRVPVHHTGFVLAETALKPVESPRRILVSGGGGRFGERLYFAAIEAHDRLQPGAPPMTIVAGPLCPEETLARIQLAAARRIGIRVVSTVSDLAQAMRGSGISVSQCGYNTALDLLRARVPALVVPFAENGDSEQADRARRLERLGALRVLDAGCLDGERLAKAIRATADFRPSPISLDLGGAQRSARILSMMHAARPASRRSPVVRARGDWLDPIRSALDAAASPVTFFVRDDDVGWSDESLFRLLEVTQACRTPIDLAAIPAAVGARLGRTLRETVIRADGLVSIHQHGWAHLNHETTSRRAEFGPARSVDQQRDDIAAGREKLQDAIGFALPAVFTPPWNRCTAATVEALTDLGFRVLSCDTSGQFGALPDSLEELPISLDWTGRRGAGLGTVCWGGAIASCIAEADRPIGLMLHHAAMAEHDRRLLADLLGALASHSMVWLRPMSQCVTRALMPEAIG